MEKRNVFRVILLSVLVSYTVCEVEDEPNHLFPESSQEMTGFKKLSAKLADIPLRSRQHNFPVQISTITDPFSSDDERIGSLDGGVLPASKDAQKSIKIRNVSTMRKLKFAMRRSARRHNVLKSTHGTGMSSSASILKNSKDMEAFAFQKTPPSSITGLQYKTKITAPFKLAILPTEETAIPSVDKADAESDWLSKEVNTTEQDDQKSSHSNDEEANFSQHGESKVTGHEGSTRLVGTSAMPQHKMAVHPGVKASPGLRWKAAYDHVKLDDSRKGKHFKNKKKKSQSEDEEPVDSSSPTATVAGILAGILMLLVIVTGVLRQWGIVNKRWRRRTCREFASDFPSTGSCSEELSEEEIIFDKSVTERNKESSKDASTKTTSEASSGRSQSQSQSDEQSSDSTTSSTESCKTPVAAGNEVVLTMEENITYPSDKSEVQSVVSMGLDDQEELSTLSECKSGSSSGEVIHTSQESEMRNATTGDTIIDVMGSENDNEETSAINEKSNQGRTHPRDAEKTKVKRKVRREDASTNPLNTGASTSSKSKIRVLNHKDYKTWKALQKDIKMKKEQGIKPRDVLPGLQTIRDIYNLPRIPVDSEGGCLCYYCEKHIKRAQREKFFKMPSKLTSFKSKSSAKEFPSGSQSSSKSSAAKIRVLNHKDYNTWKELQKDIKMKKAQGIKPRDVLPGLQVIRDIYNLPRIPVDSEGGCLCYYCEKHIKRAQRRRFFKLPRLDRSVTCA